MRPISLVLENVQSYRGRTEFDLAGLDFAVFTGENGSGKSTVAVTGPAWALFGETPAGLDDIVTTGEQEGRVEFTWQEGEDTYRVLRARNRKGRGKSILSFTRQNGDGWEPLDGANTAATEKKIAEVLRMSADLWKATVCAGGAKATNLMDLDPRERKAHLAEILGLGWYEQQCAKARKIATALEARLEAGRVQVESLRAEAGRAEELRREIAVCQDGVAAVCERLASAQNALLVAQEARGALQTQHAGVTAREKELARLRAAVDDKNVDATLLRSDLTGIAEKLAAAADLGDRIAAAQKAEAEAAAHEEKRQQDEGLLRDVQLAESQRAAAEREHKQALRIIADRIATTRREHAERIERLEAHIDSLTAQAEAMEKAPCHTAGAWLPIYDDPTYDEAPETLSLECPLLEIARTAQAALPKAREAAKDARDATPWAGDEKALADLEQDSPAKEHEDWLAELQKARRGLGYTPGEHDAAKKRAALLPGLREQQTALAGLTAKQEATQQRLDAVMGELATLVAQRDEAAAHPDLKRDWGQEIAVAFEAVTQAERAVEAARTEQSVAERATAAAEERLARAVADGEKADALEREREDLRGQLRRTEIVAAAWSVKGVPALLMDLAVPAWEDAANDLLGVLSGGALACSIITQRENKDGSLAETLDVAVSDWQGARPFATFSDGQRCMVNMALRLGLAQFLAGQVGARCDTLILDEPGEGLDDTRQQVLIEALGRLYQDGRFPTILIVSHDDSFKAAAPQRWHFTLGAEGSRMEVLA